MDHRLPSTRPAPRAQLDNLPARPALGGLGILMVVTAALLVLLHVGRALGLEVGVSSAMPLGMDLGGAAWIAACCLVAALVARFVPRD